MIVFFLNILLFNFWEKSDVERELIGENFEKKKKQVRETIKKTWEENFGRDSGRKKDVERKIRKIALWIIPLHVALFFFSSFNKISILHLF